MDSYLWQNPAAFVVDSAYRDKPVSICLRQLLQPYSYHEKLVDDHVLLAIPAR